MARLFAFRRTAEEFDGFAWSEANSLAHFEKHGIDFRIVARINWENVLKAPDLRRRYDPPRWVALGYCPALDRVLVVVYARENRIGRIISVREANEQEEALLYA
jgi:uncharacterized DUF497 family protein